MFCATWLKVVQWFCLEKMILESRQCIFTISPLSLLEKGSDPSFEHPMMTCAKFGGSDLEKMFKSLRIFSLCCYYLPLEQRVSLHVNKFEFPSPKDVFCLDCPNGSGEEIS